MDEQAEQDQQVLDGLEIRVQESSRWPGELVYVMAYHLSITPDQARAMARKLNRVADQLDPPKGAGQ